ncbi:MAG: hypothetical protein NC453_22835, partial [Muribaculum sp.]|nr:hypothetical protein [Muribaculum sp.]
ADNMYKTVGKQQQQIDDLRKTTDNHESRINTLETQGMSTQPEQPPAVIPNVTVSVPDNIPTKADLLSLLGLAIKTNSKAMAEELLELYNNLPKPTAPKYDEEVIRIAARAGADEAMNRKYSDVEYAAGKLDSRVNGIVNGVIWASIPKWFYGIFVVALLAAVGFGYGFFTQMSENSYLKDVEWMYRYSRTAYGTDEEQKFLVNREKDFFRGTTHEQDSIKDRIRGWEKLQGLDKTFLHYYPTEE